MPLAICRQDALIGVRTQYLADGHRRRTPRGDEAGATPGAGEAGAGPSPAATTAASTAAATSLGGGWKLLTLKARILDTELLE